MNTYYIYTNKRYVGMINATKYYIKKSDVDENRPLKIHFSNNGEKVGLFSSKSEIDVIDKGCNFFEVHIEI